MKTNQPYSLSEGVIQFDWEEFLCSKLISEEEWFQAQVLSSRWNTCGCSIASNTIPRDTMGVPKDETLKYLGLIFNDFVHAKDKERARQTFLKIQSRSRKLLKDMSNGK